jgi:aryl-alcohol dehydrogenase-like predicted oxidoreductase
MPARYDLSMPENQAKLEAAEQLALLAEECGLTMIHLALGFVLAHPAVTAPIIGPRTMEQLQSQLGGAQLKPSSDVLDRIDEIVPPGTTLAEFDRGYIPPSLAIKSLRRRV